LPRSSRPEPRSLLVAAISGRQLAASARRAGLTPLVTDFFADADTQELAHACCKLPGDIGRGMTWRSLSPTLFSLADAAPSPVLGLVYGSGFEDRPELLTLIAKYWPVLGNDAGTVAHIKAPESFFAVLNRLGIKHPSTTIEPPRHEAGWLTKRIGGAGGSHIVASQPNSRNRKVYHQKRVEGRPISALFVANGPDARVLGFSEQWTAPSTRCPWRYGGSVRPASVSARVAHTMTSAVTNLAREFKLKGLGSADFLVNGEDALLLEINPRPGATLDTFDSSRLPLIQLHLDAVMDGKLPRQRLKFSDAKASAIVYAKSGIAVPPRMTWPDWVADRPKPLEWIDKNRPICTVWARARTQGRAKSLVEQRIEKVLSGFRSVSRGEEGEQERRDRRSAPNGVAERQRQS
jgi:predicted ATP-grasp superfamily ATP-dependent carboligase